MIYLNVVKYIKNKINSIEYQIGDVLPSEKQLAETLGVARNTIRKAVTELVNEGLLERKHGAGTFIKNKNLQINMKRLRSVTENISLLGKQCENKVLAFSVINASSDISANLKISLLEQVYAIRRLRCIDDIPIQLEDTWMPVARFPDLSIQDMRKSKFAYIENRCGITIAGTYETFLPIMPSKSVATLLNISEKEPVIQMNTQAVDTNGIPLDYSVLITKPYEFQVKYFWPRFCSEDE